MKFNFNIYAYILFAIGLLIIVLSIYILKKNNKTNKWLAILLLSNNLWAVAYGLELSSTTLEQALLFLNIKYIGITALSFSFIIFSIHFSNKEAILKNKIYYLLLLIIPVITIILNWTDPIYHLYYKSVTIVEGIKYLRLKTTHNIGYQLFVSYFYIILSVSFYLLIYKIKISNSAFKSRNYIIIIAFSIPWASNLFYQIGLEELKYLDITPFTFILASLIILFAIIRYNEFTIKPISREEILDLMNEGILVLDYEYNIIDYNKSLKKYLNIDAKTRIIGKSLFEIFPDKNLSNQINKHINGKNNIILQQNNEDCFFESEVKFSKDQNIAGEICIIKLKKLNITQEKNILIKAQNLELDKLNQLKNRMFSIIAHDLRGPLVNLTEVLKMKAENEINLEEFLKLSPIVKKDLAYTISLMDNLFSWSLSQIQHKEIEFEFVNLRNIVLKEIEYQKNNAKNKSIEISYDLNNNIAVYSNTIMLQTIIRNIIFNAIKFSNSNGKVNIYTSEYENFTILNIADNGVGMSNEATKRIFTENDYTTRGTNNEKGTGLGMVICKDFIHKLNGEITVKSILNEGTTFQLWIPIK